MLNYPVAKSQQDHQGSQSEQLRTLVAFYGVASESSNQHPHLVWLTAASHCFQAWVSVEGGKGRLPQPGNWD